LKPRKAWWLTEGYYWDRDDKSRELANRFFARTGRCPT